MNASTAASVRGLSFPLLVLPLAGILVCAVPALAAKGDCSQPVSTGSAPMSSDCLYILRVAVGTRTCSPECICAPKGTLPVFASDALLCLRKAVGQAVTLSCPCEAPPADNFNDNIADPLRWGSDDVTGNGRLKEAGQELQYTCSSATDDDYALRPWISGVLPWGSDWTVQIDVENSSAATKNNQVSSFGLSVVDLSNYDNEVYLELYMSRYLGPPTRYGFYGELADNGTYLGEVDSGGLDVTAGAVRISYSGAGRVMTLSYDVNPADGYDWVTLGSYGVDGAGGASGNADWGMGTGDTFGVGVYGYSTLMVVPAGQMSGDNFRLTGGVAP